MGICCPKDTSLKANEIVIPQSSQVENNVMKEIKESDNNDIKQSENNALKESGNNVIKKTENNARQKSENNNMKKPKNNALKESEKYATKKTENDIKKMPENLANLSIIQESAIKETPNQKRKIEQIQPNKKQYLMLLGTAGVGKSTLFRQLGFSDVSNESTNFLVGNKKEYYFIDTPSFQLEDDIDTRENIIKQFQHYFDKQRYISSFCIVVNFERTDLMKKKVLSVLKYMRKFIDIISIIIVNMELSENPQQDKKHLEDSFKFINYNKILFIGKDMKSHEIIEKMKEIKFRETKIDLSDTIFEKITQSEENRQLQVLQNKIQQRF